jgi:virginiamycin A acetyltransferase
MRSLFKRTANVICLALMLPFWLLVKLGSVMMIADEAFLLLAHVCAVLPGKLGEYVRRAYYQWTLRKVGRDLVVGFGSFFTSRDVELASKVWIGQYTILGACRIGSGVLISDQVSILTGRHQHRRETSGKLVVDTGRKVTNTIGDDSWIGAGAVVMADIGAQCVVGAGAVLVTACSDGNTVVGVPARVVKQTDEV